MAQDWQAIVRQYGGVIDTPNEDDDSPFDDDTRAILRRYGGETRGAAQPLTASPLPDASTRQTSRGEPPARSSRAAVRRRELVDRETPPYSDAPRRSVRAETRRRDTEPSALPDRQVSDGHRPPVSAETRAVVEEFGGAFEPAPPAPPADRQLRASVPLASRGFVPLQARAPDGPGDNQPLTLADRSLGQIPPDVWTAPLDSLRVPVPPEPVVPPQAPSTAPQRGQEGS